MESRPPATSAPRTAYTTLDDDGANTARRSLAMKSQPSVPVATALTMPRGPALALANDDAQFVDAYKPSTVPATITPRARASTATLTTRGTSSPASATHASVPVVNLQIAS